MRQHRLCGFLFLFLPFYFPSVRWKERFISVSDCSNTKTVVGTIRYVENAMRHLELKEKACNRISFTARKVCRS